MQAMKVGIQGTSVKSGSGFVTREVKPMEADEDVCFAGVLLLHEGTAVLSDNPMHLRNERLCIHLRKTLLCLQQ